MKFLAPTLLASLAAAAPMAKRAVTDADILQFALTLEHLENAFYQGALNKISELDFLTHGYGSQYYKNLQYIAYDEKEHVKLLSGALAAAGAKPVEPCTYSFPYSDAKSFVALSSILEGVGTSAYLGAAGLISNKDYLGVAGSILVTEALHTSLQRYSLGLVAPASPYGTGLGANEVYTLAASFITACPSTNTALPFKSFPALTAVSKTPANPGSSFSFSTKTAPTGTFFVTWVSGLTTVSTAASMSSGNIKTTIPPTAMGQSYAILTNANVTSLTDAAVIAGPAVVEVTPPAPK